MDSGGRWTDEDLSKISANFLRLETLRLAGNSGSLSSDAIESMIFRLQHCLKSIEILGSKQFNNETLELFQSDVLIREQKIS